MQPENTPHGRCCCGCGGETNWNRKTKAPRKYLQGHQRRGVFYAGPDFRIDLQTGCWNWLRGKTRGYGETRANGKNVMAYRLYYEIANGPIRDGLHLDHLCRNPACVNPAHLEPVTRRENTRRGLSAKLTREQVLEIRAAPTGYGTGRALAREYGVHAATISDIRHRRIWADVV